MTTSTGTQGRDTDKTFVDNCFRTQLQENALLGKYYCDVNINDLINYNEELAHRLVTEPAEIIPLVCLPSSGDVIASSSNTCIW